MQSGKMKKIGNIKYLFIIFIIGIIILIFGNSMSGKDKEKKKMEETKESVSFERGAYAEEMRLEEILSEIKGVGRVSVMVSYENNGTSNYLSDSTYESDAGEGVKKSEKVVMTAGEPVEYEKKFPKVKGVVVVCDGAKSENVRRDVVSAVCAVTGVYEHRVGVFENK